MLCRNCYKMVSDDAKICPECGADLKSVESQGIGSGFENFDSATTSNTYQPDQKVQASMMNKPKAKQSKLGVIAAILAILGITSLIGVILGIIDLVKNKNDGNKHSVSIFAIIWGALMHIILIIIVGTIIVGNFFVNFANSTPQGEEFARRMEVAVGSEDGSLVDSIPGDDGPGDDSSETESAKEITGLTDENGDNQSQLILATAYR